MKSNEVPRSAEVTVEARTELNIPTHKVYYRRIDDDGPNNRLANEECRQATRRVKTFDE